MLLDVLDDVFLLHFPLEAAESAFNRLTVLNLDLGHLVIHPPWQSPSSPRLSPNTTEACVTLIGDETRILGTKPSCVNERPRDALALGASSNYSH